MIRALPFLLFFSLVIASPSVRAQRTGRTIMGVVTAEGSPLEGALIQVKGSKMLTGTLYDGAYYIPVTPGDSILIFSHMDCETKEIKLSSTNEYNIELKKCAKPNRDVLDTVNLFTRNTPQHDTSSNYQNTPLH